MSTRNQKTAIAKLDALKVAPTLADFAAWLATSQQNELSAMSAATGDTFGKRCDRFIELTAAINALREFQQVAAASATTTPTTSEATADKPCLKNGGAQ